MDTLLQIVRWKNLKLQNWMKPLMKKFMSYCMNQNQNQILISLVQIVIVTKSDHSNQCVNCTGNTCTCGQDEFYKLQSQFEDSNLDKIQS